jgi:PHD/YefM family antitoxin component YafN of YafNO toxin-antitoxin module
MAVILSPDDFEGLLETMDILQDEAGLSRLKKAKRQVLRGQTRTLEAIRASFKLV